MFNLCIGITNETVDGFQIPFLDFDIKDKEKILYEIKYLIDKYTLSTFYLFESSNGYNAFCFDKLPTNELLTVIDDTKLVCKDFITYSKKRGYFTLRLGFDKKFNFDIVGYGIRDKSFAHAKYLSEFYNFKYYYGMVNRYDKNTFLHFETYKSKKHNFFDGIEQIQNKEDNEEFDYNRR